MDRILRKVAGSLTLTIPKQVCDILGYKAGDHMGFEIIGTQELKIKKT